MKCFIIRSSPQKPNRCCSSSDNFSSKWNKIISSPLASIVTVQQMHNQKAQVKLSFTLNTLICFNIWEVLPSLRTAFFLLNSASYFLILAPCIVIPCHAAIKVKWTPPPPGHEDVPPSMGPPSWIIIHQVEVLIHLLPLPAAVQSLL